MATFTPPTFDTPYDNELGRFGLSWPTGYMVVIDTEDNVTPYPGAIGLTDPDQTADVAADGSGDGGLAIFSSGRTYTVNSTEETLLTGAGYDVT